MALTLSPPFRNSSSRIFSNSVEALNSSMAEAFILGILRFNWSKDLDNS